MGSVAIGLLTGKAIEHYNLKPRSVYMLDLNNDAYKDHVIKSLTQTEIFLGQADGNFKRLEDFEEAEKDSIEAKVKEIEERAKKLK